MALEQMLRFIKQCIKNLNAPGWFIIFILQLIVNKHDLLRLYYDLFSALVKQVSMRRSEITVQKNIVLKYTEGPAIHLTIHNEN